MNRIITLTAFILLTGCVGGAHVTTSGETIDIADFKGVLTVNIDNASGDLKNNPILKSNIEREAVLALGKKYGNMTSYAVLSPAATPEELKMTPQQALKGRGYTYFLIVAINPVQSHTTTSTAYNQSTKRNETTSSTTHSMSISCTVYRLSDGLAISHANADAFGRDKGYWERWVAQTIFSSETSTDRWELGTIYSCDEALKAVIKQPISPTLKSDPA